MRGFILFVLVLFCGLSRAWAQTSGPEGRLEKIERDRKRRLEALEETLLERLTARAAKQPGYRAARSHFFLWKIRALTKENDSSLRTVPQKLRSELKGRVQQYYENTAAFSKELAGKALGAISQQDKERARRLGIGRDIGEWSFASVHSVSHALALFSCVGETPFWSPIPKFTFRPAPAQLDPVYKARALALFETAISEAKKREVPREMIEQIALHHAECLAFLGQRKAAIARLERFLSSAPDALSPEVFQRFKTKIQRLSSDDASSLAYRKALKTCAVELYGMFHEEAQRVARGGGMVNGVAGLREMVDSVERQCGKTPYGDGFKGGVYYHAARMALWLGDCKAFSRFLDRARSLGPSFVKPLEALGAGCIEG